MGADTQSASERREDSSMSIQDTKVTTGRQQHDSTSQTASLTAVQTALNYLTDVTDKPYTYMYTPPAGTPIRTGEYAPRPMTIYDGRALRDQLTLDQNGFMLTSHETTVTNFYDEKEVRTVYYPEVAELVKQVTGATKVIVFDHNVRCAPKAKRKENGAREPVMMAHNDYTLRSGPQRVRDLLPADEAETLLKHRFAVINVWRPIQGPVLDAPLAVCDAQTLSQQHFVAMDLRYHDRTGEVYAISYSPDQRWFYFSQMQTNEAMLLKCYDSMEDGRARFTAHSAFQNPTAPPDAPARESIEARTLVFFAPGTVATQ